MIKSKWLMAVAVIAITLPALAPSSSAEASSFLEKIFGKKNADDPQTPPPEVTLQAPFPTAPDKASAAQNPELMNIYNSKSTEQNSVSLDQPHRNQQQVSEWAAGIVSQAMTITPDTWDADFNSISANFTPYAAKEYKDYIQTSNFINILTSNAMRLQAISNDSAIVTKEGAIGGTYHWLIQVPLMTSFYKTSMKEVDKNATSQNQNLLVQVQVGRVQPKSATDIGLVIERWHVSAVSGK